MTSRQLHAQALDLREKGKFAESVAINDEALRIAQEEGDIGEYVANIACLALTRRVRAQLANDTLELKLAEGEMQAAVEIAKSQGNIEDIAVPLYQLAQIKEDLGKFGDAVKVYKEAFEYMQKHPPASHDRSSVLADLRVHMTTCEYKAGDKTALERALDALKDLESAEENDDFSKKVWVSGGYMRLATILKNDDPENSRKYFEIAKEIIESDDRLVVRKKQLDQLVSLLSS